MTSFGNAGPGAARSMRCGVVGVVVVAALAIITAIGVVSGIVMRDASADDAGKPVYATAVLEKIADGTGHGTTAQTFVNAGNGFTPGDDTPDDGVVSSGDTVTYRLKLSFTAAQKRNVTVKWNLDNAPYLEGVADATGFCTPGQLVTARRNGDACTFTVPAGAVETVQQTLTLRAKDTGGVAVKDQKPTLSVSRDGQMGGAVDYPVAPVTVVSAPAADLVIDNGGDPDNRNGSWERRTTWAENGSMSGYIDAKVKPLTYPGSATTHGASTTGPWSATFDVSQFPQGSTFTMDGENLPVRDGKITVTGKTGDRRLDWTVPTEQVKDMQEGGVRHYDIHIIPDKTVFQASDAEDALKNLGTGGEPGTDRARDESTLDRETGAKAGYPYANNDWTRALIYRDPIPQGRIFWKNLYRPYTPGKTLFDPETQDFDKAAGSQTVYHDADLTGDSVSRQTQVRTLLGMRTSNIVGLTPGSHPTISDRWTPSEAQWEGRTEVKQGDRTLTEGADYTFSYTYDDPGKGGAKWTGGIPVDTDHRVRAVTVEFNQNAGVKYGPGTPDVTVTFVTRAIADPSNGNRQVRDDMNAKVESTGGGLSGGSMYDYIWVVAPKRPSATIGMSVQVKDPDGNERKDNLNATPGDTATYLVRPELSNVQLSGTSVKPTVTVPYPDGLLDLKATGAEWNMTVEGTGPDRTLKFTLNKPDGSVIPNLNEVGDTRFPDITFTGRVSNLASGAVTAAATLKVDVDANGTVPSYPNVTSNTATASFTLNGQSSESGILTADQTRVEINDPVSFTFNLYAKGTGRTGRSDTVVHIPSNQDKQLLGKNNTGLDGTWNEYDRGSSAYHGTYKLTDPVDIRTDNSTPTTVTYTTTVAWSDDPADYQWRAWDQLSDADRARVTAFRVVSDFTGGSDASMPVAAANGTVTIHPADNNRDDQYNMWPGRTRFTDGHTMGNLPWADRTTVVAGSISGTVWWDRDENATLDDGEDRIPGVTVTLWRTDDQGNKQGEPVDTTTTGKQGDYKFELLHSGDYMTEVKRSDGTVTDTGVQTKVTTYYNQEKNVANTYSWNWQLRDHARDTSNRIPLGIGQNQTRVDFGYAKPDPKATLDKTQTSLDCKDDSCTVNWDVKVTNSGKTTGRLPNGNKTIETISADGHHSLALDSAGNAWEWGYNNGATSSSSSTTPVKVKAPDGVTFTQVSAGYFHSLAIGSDGNTYAWGYDSSGQLGDGATSSSSTTPVKVKAPDGVTFTQVSAGYNHSLALDSAGNVWAWGSNGDGKLGNGNGSIPNLFTPAKVTLEGDIKFIQVSAGNDYSLALDRDGNAWAWGSNGNGQLGNGSTGGTQLKPQKTIMPADGTKFTQVSAGDDHSLALDGDGNAWAWGNNIYGKLGNNNQEVSQSTPVRVNMPDGVRFTQVSAGYDTSSAIDMNGNAWAWGSNSTGQLGNGDTDNQSITPVKVTMPEGGVKLTQISVGVNHSLALGSDGTAYAWGNNNFGKLGNGNTDNQSTPISVKQGDVKYDTGVQDPVDDSTPSTGTSTFPQSSTLTDRMSSIVGNVSATVGTVSRTPDQTTRFTQISAGSNYSLALDTSGNAWAWGLNDRGQLGNGSLNEDKQHNTPVSVSMPEGVKFTQVSAGASHSLALDTSGNAWAWGLGGNGQLGNGTIDNQLRPVPVSMPEGVKFTQVSAGKANSLAIGSDGNTYAWGDNGYGQLGNDTTNPSSTPVKVKATDGVSFTQVSAGGRHSLAIGSDGNTYAWGSNFYDQLGEGESDGNVILTSPTPVRVKAPDGVSFTQVSAGNNHSLAIGSDGNTYTWGKGDKDDSAVIVQDWSTPVSVNAPTGVTFTQVSARNNHSIAIGSDGNTYTWGHNEGQTGNVMSTDVPISNPSSVPMPDGVRYTQVSTGDNHSLAIGSDGNTYAWGSNGTGQLGGTTDNPNITLVSVKAPTKPGVSTDPTAIPISPTSTSQADADTIRVYNLPYEVQPGGYVVYHFTGTIRRTDKDRIIHNQAWFDSPDTPYSGTPHALEAKAGTPTGPDDSKLDGNSHNITGNTSCRTGTDYKTPDMEHWFSTSAEDSCDQVGVVIPAHDKGVKQEVGSISGLYWIDTNADGVRQDSETIRIPGQQVVLEDADGNQLSTTTTGANGEYSFTDLQYGGYRVRFSRVTGAEFTGADANDTDKPNDASSTDSDADTGDDYGMGTPVIVLKAEKPDWRNIAAGVLSPTPLTGMPFTGTNAAIILLLMLATAVAVRVAAGRRGVSADSTNA